jgi:pimeloyl-ACP methyl ester carboxylesterase
MNEFEVELPEGRMAGYWFGASSAGPRLVFLHATGFNARTYQSLLAPLSDRHTTLALDLRGHGRTSLPAQPRRMTSWAAYAKDVAKALDLVIKPGERFVLAGHSLGGAVSALTAALRPEGVAGVVMLDPAMAPPAWTHYARLPFAPRLLQRVVPIARAAGKRRADFPSKAAALQSYTGRGAFKSWGGSFLADYVEDAFKPTSDGVTLSCRPAWEMATFAALRHNAWRALQRLNCPIWLDVAERHSTVRDRLADVRRFQPATQITLIDGGSHFFPMEQPERIRERLLAALEIAG